MKSIIHKKHIYKFSINKQDDKRERYIERKVTFFLGIPIFKAEYAEDSYVSKEKVQQGFK